VPADGLVVDGDPTIVADPFMAPPVACRPGTRLAAGARIEGGTGSMRIERPAARSRTARLHAHVRHALCAREIPGPLTPDLQRVIAVPMTAAALVLTLTGDPARTAAMLQADPQMGIGLAQPVAREAALYAIARHGALLSGLETVDRLAGATTFAFEDIGILTDPTWFIDRVETSDPSADVDDARRWLGRVFGLDRPALLDAGMLDADVAAVRQHGMLLRDADRTLHIGGAGVLARTWNLPLPQVERTGLVRRLGIVDTGRLLATVFLTCRVRPDVAAQLARLRTLGVQRIAVFSEDLTEDPAQVLAQIGADVVLHRSRVEQERWLDRAVERGERIALVHTGLRDLLPPGGLSLCPVDAEAGAHGVLLGDPLASLLASRAAALQIRRELRGRFGRSVALNSALMIAAAMRWAPPWAITTAKHGATFLLLEQSGRLARVETGARFTPTGGSTSPAPRSGRAGSLHSTGNTL
jgi:cation transport ATPase